MRALQVFFMLLPFAALAQTDSSYGFSKFQQYLMEPGRWARITTDTIGTEGNLDMGVLTATDLNSGEKRRAVCFKPASVFTSTIFTVTNTQVDIEELDKVITVLDTIYRSINHTGTRDVQQFRYVSSGLTVITGGNRAQNPRRWDIDIYRRYKQFDVPVYGTNIRIREENVEAILQLLIRYRAALGNDLYRER